MCARRESNDVLGKWTCVPFLDSFDARYVQFDPLRWSINGGKLELRTTFGTSLAKEKSATSGTVNVRHPTILTTSTCTCMWHDDFTALRHRGALRAKAAMTSGTWVLKAMSVALISTASMATDVIMQTKSTAKPTVLRHEVLKAQKLPSSLAITVVHAIRTHCTQLGANERFLISPRDRGFACSVPALRVVLRSIFIVSTTDSPPS